MIGALIVIGWSMLSTAAGVFVAVLVGDKTLGNITSGLVGALAGAAVDVVGLSIIFSMVHV